MNFKDYIFISSQDLQTGSITNGVYKLHRPIINKDHCELDVFICPNTIYNINTNNNNITFNDGSIFTATITPGVYTRTQLISAIQTALNNTASSLIFTVSFNDNTLKITISASGNFSLLFGSGTNQMNKILGFLNFDTSSLTNHTASNVFNLGLPNFLFITIYELGINYNGTNSNDLVTYIVPVNVNSQDYIEYYRDIRYSQIANISQRTIENLFIVIRDENNNIIELNGSDFFIILKLY